ncbi:MAG TPA: radical SAM protein [Archangium sp.]|nr:radical SAM protein [Archangium sp.]
MDAERTEAVVTAVQGWPEERRRAANLALLEQVPLFDIEVASACNIVCSFCPREEMARPKGLMSETTFQEILTFLPGDAVVMISGLGDALLHPRLEHFVEALSARGLFPCVITNGIRLTPDRQRRLIAAGVAQFQVSVHGLDARELAPIVTRGARPEQVRENLEQLAANRPEHLRVRVNFVETPDNAHCREGVRSWATALGFDFFYRRLHTRGGSITSHRPASGCQGCGIFGAVTFITVEGALLPCVNDVRGEGQLGHVRDLTWAQLVERKRTVIREGTWFGACRTCDDDYRWVILANGQVDEGKAERGRTAKPG